MSQWRARLPDLAIGAALATAVLVAFAPALRNGFVNYDDQLYVTNNPVTQQGLSASSAAWAFTTVWAANWHPLTWLSVMLDVELFGLDPRGHHATSLALHALNTTLVFAFMRRLGIGRGPSAFAAGLFGLHPLRVESVAWVAERKDVLSMAFGLFTLLAYIRYAEAPSRRRLAAVAAALVLGLLAKPVLVTFPFVLLLLDWWPLRRVASPAWIASPDVAPGEGPCIALARQNLRRLIVEKTPLFTVALLSCAVTYWAQAASNTVFVRLPFAARVANAMYSYVAYLVKIIFPLHLSAFYPLRELGAGQVAAYFATLAMFTFIAWRFRTTQPCLLVGWLWYLGTLVPMIGLVQVGIQGYADRYTYLPSLGLGFAASLGLSDVVERAHLSRPVVLLAAGALLAAFGVGTFQQTFVWRNTVTLFEPILAMPGHDPSLRVNLASELIENQEFERARDMLEQALAEGAPPAKVHVDMSALYDRDHRPEEALREIDAALALEPDNANALLNRGIYLTELRRDAEAVPILERVIALNAGNDAKLLAIAHRTLATARRRLGLSDEAVPHPAGDRAAGAAPR